MYKIYYATKHMKDNAAASSSASLFIASTNRARCFREMSAAQAIPSRRWWLSVWARCGPGLTSRHFSSHLGIVGQEFTWPY